VFVKEDRLAAVGWTLASDRQPQHRELKLERCKRGFERWWLSPQFNSPCLYSTVPVRALLETEPWWQ